MLRDLIIWHLSCSPSPLDEYDFERELSVNAVEIKKVLEELRASGEIKHDARGFYLD